MQQVDRRKLHQKVGFISLATNMLEGWDIFHLKSGIHSSVWSTKKILYDIRKLRYQQIKMGYQISKDLHTGETCVLKSDVCLFSLATNMLEDWDIFHLKSVIHSTVWSTKIFLYHIRKLRYKQIKMGYQILKFFVLDHFNVLKSDALH